MKLAKKLLVSVIAALPIVIMATAVSAHAWGGGSYWGTYQPQFPRD